MRAALISLGSVSSIMTIEEMKKHFDTVDMINLKKIEVQLGKDIQVLYDNKLLETYDCIYAKGSFRYANILKTITESRFGSCYMPLSAQAFTLGHDKLQTHIALNKAHIPMPDTYIASSLDAAKKILEKVNYPIIMKFPQGTQGKGVMYADSYASASSILDALHALNQPFLVQAYIETGGSDIRALVVGDKVVASMKRIARPLESRANIHAGAVGEAITLDHRTAKIAVETAKAISADICGVDILETPHGPLVIEANVSPGLQGITAVTKENVAGKIAKFLADKTQKFLNRGKDDKASKMVKEAGLNKNIHAQQIITQLDFRGERILLPKLMTDMSGFDEKDEFVVTISKGKVSISKM